MPRSSQDDVDKAAIERVHEIVGMLENALFLTFQAADARSERHRKRHESREAWTKLTDAVIDFAMEDQ